MEIIFLNPILHISIIKTIIHYAKTKQTVFFVLFWLDHPACWGADVGQRRPVIQGAGKESPVCSSGRHPACWGADVGQQGPVTQILNFNFPSIQ